MLLKTGKQRANKLHHRITFTQWVQTSTNKRKQANKTGYVKPVCCFRCWYSLITTLLVLYLISVTDIVLTQCEQECFFSLKHWRSYTIDSSPGWCNRMLPLVKKAVNSMLLCTGMPTDWAHTTTRVYPTIYPSKYGLESDTGLSATQYRSR